MDSLGGYLLLAVSTGVLSGVAACATHPSLRSSAEGVVGILVVLAVVAPVLGFVSSPRELVVPELEELGEGEYVRVAAAAMERGIEEDVASRFSVDIGEVTVVCEELDVAVMRCRLVTVALSCPSHEANFTKIREYVLENYVKDGGRCEMRWSYE